MFSKDSQKEGGGFSLQGSDNYSGNIQEDIGFIIHEDQVEGSDILKQSQIQQTQFQYSSYSSSSSANSNIQNEQIQAKDAQDFKISDLQVPQVTQETDQEEEDSPKYSKFNMFDKRINLSQVSNSKAHLSDQDKPIQMRDLPSRRNLKPQDLQNTQQSQRTQNDKQRMSSNSYLQHDLPQQLSQHQVNSSCLTASNANLQQSQAIAGAMKALQQKLSTYEEQYNLLNQQNQMLNETLIAVQQKQTNDKEKLGEMLHKQKSQYQVNEKEMKTRIDQDQQIIDDLAHRMEQSSRGFERLTKENLNLKRDNQTLLIQVDEKNFDAQKKVLVASKEKRDSETKYKKKAKKLQLEKKDLQKTIQTLTIEFNNQKNYYEQLIGDLEYKLHEVIGAKNQDNSQYAEYKRQQEKVLKQSRQELADLQTALSNQGFRDEDKECENQKLRADLQLFQSEMSLVKKQLANIQKAHQAQERARSEAVDFVSDIVTVNEMLVQSIQKKKGSSRSSAKHQQSIDSSQVLTERDSNFKGSKLQLTNNCLIIGYILPKREKQDSQHSIKTRPLPVPESSKKTQEMRRRNSTADSENQLKPINVETVMTIPDNTQNIENIRPSRAVQVEEEVQKFQDKYDQLLKDIAASKMPLQSRRQSKNQGSTKQVPVETRM